MVLFRQHWGATGRRTVLGVSSLLFSKVAVFDGGGAGQRVFVRFYTATICEEKFFLFFTTFSDGCLGFDIDEGRSKMR